MVNMKFAILILFCLLLAPFVFAEEGEVYGQYIGVLKHKTLKMDQLAQLDLIFSRQEKGSGTNGGTKVSAILKLFFGSFDKGEYVSYDYYDVKLFLPQQTLIFKSDDVPVSFLSAKIKDGEFIANIQAFGKQDIGELRLLRKGMVQPTQPLVPQLWGKYLGYCDQKKTELNLLTYRSSKNINSTGNPFSAYDIRGQTLARYLSEDETLSVKNLVIGGSYDFYSGNLNLNYRGGKLACKVTPSGLDCNQSCVFKRVVPPLALPITRFELKPVFPMPSTEKKKGSFQSGIYSGYLHHEFLNRYQKVNLNLNVYQTEAGTRIETTGKLIFGNEVDQEHIPLQFSDGVYPKNPEHPALVLTNPNSDMDATLEIYPYANGVLRGIWYSHMFGRVGTFEIAREEIPIPKLPVNSEFIEKVSGKYQNPWNSVLINVRQENAPINTANPFAPNLLEGYFRDRIVFFTKQILGGSYDFYTGRIAFEVEPMDGLVPITAGLTRPTRVWVGNRETRTSMKLYLATEISMSNGKFEPEEFELQSD